MLQCLKVSFESFESDPLLLGGLFHVAYIFLFVFYLCVLATFIESGDETMMVKHKLHETDSNLRHPHEHHSSMRFKQ